MEIRTMAPMDPALEPTLRNQIAGWIAFLKILMIGKHL